VAITDILTRLEDDAAAEAAAMVAAAESEAARIIAHARGTVASERVAALEGAERDGAAAAATLLANARLGARDGLLTEKRARAELVLKRAREALESLPDSEYLDLIADEVARTVRGGETLSVAPADAERLVGLKKRLESLGLSVALSDDPAPVARGVLLTGDRVRTEISAAALTEDQRDRLLLAASRVLFGGGE